MRELKFRAWDNEKEQLEYPIDKTIATENGTEFNVICYRFMNGGMPVITSFGDCVRYPSRYILMQFTGLKDKKGKEIYEGDIVKNERGEVGIIKFGNGAFVSEYIPPHNWDAMEPIDGLLNKQEIIGNVHENPELLKE